MNRQYVMAVMVLLMSIMMFSTIGRVHALKAQAPAASASEGGSAGAAAPASSGGGHEAAPSSGGGGGMWHVLTRSGPFGIFLWLCLIGSSVALVALVIDSFVSMTRTKIVPKPLTITVQQSMQVGDLMKAVKACDDYPSPLASVLKAGFAQVEEGFEVIQEAVGVASSMEIDRLMIRVGYLNVVANVAPMLGLIGTVYGIILTLNTMATMPAGAARQAMMAMNIGEGLWATTFGLSATVPAMFFFQFFKNRVNGLALEMERLTMHSIKALRNVEVVKE